jgi:uncharacterized protein YecE (DUF72 family)
MRKKTVVVYWLMPARPERELFRDLVRILAKPFGGPQFEPHLTLCRAADRQSAAEVLRRVKAEPIRLRVRSVSFSSKFTKTLFLGFQSSALLEKLIVDLRGKAKSLRDPHLSLLYGRLPGRVKEELAAAIKLPMQRVVFDRLQAVRCPAPTETRAEVKSWQVIASRRLTG